MVQEKIRPRYVGLLSFLSRIFALFTGFAFITLVSRKLPVEIFGAWQYFSSVLVYFIIPASVINFWATREAGREKIVGRTTIQLSFFVSLVSLSLFLLLANLNIFVRTEIPNFILYIFALWIFAYFITTSAEAVNYGLNPTLNVISSIIFEIIKLFFGVLLVVIFNLSLFGAVLAIVLALLLEFMFFVVMNPKMLSGNFDRVLIKKWTSNAWLPLVNVLPGFIASLDVIFLGYLLGSNSVIPIAYYKAALTFGSLVGYAGAISFAVYPKVLKEGIESSKSYIEDIISLTNMFGIPMMFGAIILSEPLLCILREEYSVARDALILFSISNLIGANKSIFTSVLLGSEKADESVNSFSKDLINSILFKLPVIDSINSFLYVLTLALITIVLVDLKAKYELFATALAFSNLIWNFIFTTYYFIKVKSLIKLNLPKSQFMKYIISSLVMSIVLILMYPKSAVSEKLSLVLYGVFPVVAVGAVVYFVVLFLIDKNTRVLTRRAILLLTNSANLK
ncbi:MAG: hypothetical protein QXS21_01695 [Thermoproteota archaeon]|nr:hypothetical protein [Candidatus Brockarchaeota archaeon]